MKKYTYLQSAIILTLANIVTNVIAFVYRIFLTRSISVEGVGLYQLILPLYNLFITLVSGGITTGISKVISVQKVKNNGNNIKKIVKVYSLVALIWSSVITTLLIFNAEFIATHILRDVRTTLSIKMFAPAIVFISLAAVIKGYFYGMEIVSPPAFVDIAEKITRIVVITTITSLLLPYGIVYVCAGALFSMTMGEFISLFLLYVIYRKKNHVNSIQRADISNWNIVKTVTMLALPLSISGALNTIVEIICAVLIPRELELGGMAHSEALSLYGKLTGMALPLALFPMVIIFSLSSTLIPSIAASFERKNWLALNKKCNDAIKITAVIAFTSFIFLVTDPRALCDLAFRCADAGDLLFYLSFGIAFEFLHFILFAILNALDKQVLVLRVTILNIFITLVCIFVLIPIPSIHVYGYIIGFILSSIVVFFICLLYLLRMPNIKINLFKSLLLPTYCAIFAFCINILIRHMGFDFIHRVTISLGSYCFLLLLTGTFSIKQVFKTLLFR